MTYHAVRNTGSSDVWVAEPADADGQTFLAIFVGKYAKSRAEEYANWKKRLYWWSGKGYNAGPAQCGVERRRRELEPNAYAIAGNHLAD